MLSKKGLTCRVDSKPAQSMTTSGPYGGRDALSHSPTSAGVADACGFKHTSAPSCSARARLKSTHQWSGSQPHTHGVAGDNPCFTIDIARYSNRDSKDWGVRRGERDALVIPDVSHCHGVRTKCLGSHECHKTCKQYISSRTRRPIKLHNLVYNLTSASYEGANCSTSRMSRIKKAQGVK